MAVTTKKSKKLAPRASKNQIAGLKIQRILVPIDFSGVANLALSYAIPLAKSLGAKIILLHVVEPIYTNTEPGFTFIPEPIAGQGKAENERLRELADKYIPADLCEKIVVRWGAPYNEITSAAKILKAGLIVVTTHGRTGLGHVLLGSTAERVVRHAPCPVLTVRRPK
jgi:universal stress protein A